MLAISGASQAAVNVSASFTPSTAVASETVAYTLTITSTEPLPLSQAALSVNLSGVTSILNSPEINTCNFTVNSSGNTLNLSQGSLPPAPSNGSASCQIRVRVQTVSTPNAYTTTVASGSLSTDEGFTNSGPASASFNLAPLSLPELSLSTQDSRVASPHIANNTSTTLALSGDIGSSSYNLNITNPNNVEYTVTSAVLTVPGNSYQPSLSGAGCSISGFTPQITDTARPRPNFYTIGLGTLVIPAAGNCTISMNIIPEASSQRLYQNDNVSSGFDKNEIHLLSGFNNGDNLSLSAVGLINPPLGFSLLVNGLKTATLTSTTSPVNLGLSVRNVTNQNRTFTTSLALPSQFTGGTLGVSGTGCDLSGVTVDDTAKTWNFNPANVPAGTTCTYTLNTQRGSISSASINVFNNQITTDWRPSPASFAGTATQVQLNVPTTGTSTASVVGSSYLGPVSNVVVLRNETSTDTSGVDARVRWDRAWNASLADSSTTCVGGTLSLNGQELNMTGASIPSGASCSIVTAFRPEEVTPTGNANFSHSVTVGSGPSFNPVNTATTNLLPPSLFGIMLPFNIATGEKARLNADLNNRSVNSHSGQTLEISLNGFQPELDSVSVSCRANGTPIYNQAVPTGNVSVTGSTLSILLPDNLPTPVFVPASPYSASSVSEVICRTGVTVARTTAGSVSSTLRMTSPASQTGFTNGNYNATIYDAPSYSQSLNFSPSTIRAGQNSSLNISNLVPTTGNVTGTRFRREFTLTEGLIFNTTSLTDRGGWWGSGTNITPECDLSRTCDFATFGGWIILPDRQTFIQYLEPYNGGINLSVTATQYGDLTSTLTSSETTPINGGSAYVVSDASATLKVDPSLIIGLDWNPAQVYSDQNADLNVSIFNANPINDTINVPITLGSVTDTNVTPVLGGNCGGTLSWNPSTRVANLTGVNLNSNSTCVATITVKQSRVASNVSNTAQIAAGAARAVTSNTGNQFAVSSTLTVQPIPICLQTSGLTLRNLNLTSPGSGSLSANFVNTGGSAINGTNISWTTPLDASGNYSFDGATPATTLQEAWNNRVTQNGTLGVNGTTTLNATYTNPSGQSRGDVLTLPLEADSSGWCEAISVHTITTIKAAPTIAITQANCEVNSEGDVSCVPAVTADINTAPCRVIRYTLNAINGGDAALQGATLQLTAPEGTQPVAWGSLSGDTLYRQSGGSGWNLNSGERTPMTGDLELRPRQSGLTPGNLLPGQQLRAFMDVQVRGENCAAAR